MFVRVACRLALAATFCCSLVVFKIAYKSLKVDCSLLNVGKAWSMLNLNLFEVGNKYKNCKNFKGIRNWKIDQITLWVECKYKYTYINTYI